ncbi:RWP-RK domain-containing protein [Artemisia annua]|uniref:RWP-RK domain-containing protein n=1 Tax=Artemisia annua TaxID=35608 RepID=A0A2U1KTN3_ARTAN|nr:RWP-RK domain-containing protein [Artemisia annua]
MEVSSLLGGVQVVSPLTAVEHTNEGGLVVQGLGIITLECVRSQVQFLLGANNLKWPRQPPEKGRASPGLSLGGGGFKPCGLVRQKGRKTKNHKLETIPTLAKDLHEIIQLSRESIKFEQCTSDSEEAGKGKEDKENQCKNRHRCDVDLNSLPSGLSENEGSVTTGSDQSVTDSLHSFVCTCHHSQYSVTADFLGKKKRRAATKVIASLALEDLSKYFGVPIIQASKSLKVGLTVLKKKCREFGIPRWPHRKIKSLDGLLSNLQVELARQRGEEDTGAARAVAEMQKMIESEKETIEKKPFMDIQRETKKIRQDIFKKRHRAKALEGQCQTLPLF